MKKQIRRGVFETNSSSVHSLTMCSSEEYQKWVDGAVLFFKWNDKFSAREDVIKQLKSKSWLSGANWDDEDEVNEIFLDEGVMTYNEFFSNDRFETFEYRYTTPSGDEVVAFGYYGYDR